MVKKIHYCWFGGEKPDLVKRNIESWALMNPDFEICEWNEANVDVASHGYKAFAVQNRMWAFLSDVVRLEALIQHGGFYMDTDVELIRPLKDVFETCKEEGADGKLTLGYMYDCALGTAVIYAPPQHPYLKEILHSYQYLFRDRLIVNNTIFTAYFINQVKGFFLTGQPWENELCCVHRKEYFEQPAFIKSHGISIHHCGGSWKDSSSGSYSLSSQLNYFHYLLKWASRKVRTWRALQCNEFHGCYKAAMKGVRQLFDISKIYSTENPYDEVVNET